MLGGTILLKGLIAPLLLLLGVPNGKTYSKSRPETILKLLTFTFDPFFNVKWGYLISKALNLSIFTDSMAGDNCCGSGFVCTKMLILRIFYYLNKLKLLTCWDTRVSTVSRLCIIH